MRRFYFSELEDGDNPIIESTHSFYGADEVAGYLSEKSLTHGIVTIYAMSNGDISTMLKPLRDYSVPGIDSEVIDRFLRLKSV